MKKVAIVGFGFMGRMHYGCWKRLGGAKVAALCDSNLAQLKRASGGKVVTSTVSWAPTGEFGFEAGFRVVFERATAVCTTRPAEDFTVYPAKGKPFSPKLSKRTGYENEIKWFLAHVNGTAAKGPLTPQDARDSVALVDAERKSARTGKRVIIR